MHALTDAILGALCLPDIGQLFPDTDPKWKGANSDTFIKEAVSERQFTLSLFLQYCAVLCVAQTTAMLEQYAALVYGVGYTCSSRSICRNHAVHASLSITIQSWYRALYLQVRLMHERGYHLGNVDITIIAQQPKLSPHKENMRDQLCQLLGSHPSTVNIKVSTESGKACLLAAVFWLQYSASFCI